MRKLILFTAALAVSLSGCRLFRDDCTRCHRAEHTLLAPIVVQEVK